MENELKYGTLIDIDVRKISPHPDNPRKDLGDLSELAESIKVNGVLQNLTVVPRLGEITGDFIGLYTVVIGHRRLAAAKLAGLETVPCIVSNMNGMQQIRTMLTENMQRTDLTVYEQAQGFQMMLDLGDTVTQISERTGFSPTTVRRRVKLLELDKTKFKKATERGATLMDFAELEKIEDNDLRNEVLETIGTANFRERLKSALDREKMKKYLAGVIAVLETFATKIESSDYRTMSLRKSYGFWTIEKETTVPKDAQTARYYYKVTDYGVDVYLDKADEPVDEEAERLKLERCEREKKNNALREVTKRASRLREDYIHELAETAKVKKLLPVIMEYAVCGLLTQDISLIDHELFAALLDIELDKWKYADIAPLIEEKPEAFLLAATYCKLDDNDRYYNWKAEYEPNDGLDRLYAFMEAIGYEVSDEERAMMNGTHELFRGATDE